MSNRDEIEKDIEENTEEVASRQLQPISLSIDSSLNQVKEDLSDKLFWLHNSNSKIQLMQMPLLQFIIAGKEEKI